MPDTPPPDTLDTHSTDVRYQRFEAAWRAWRDGEPPRWQDHLPPPGEPCNAELVSHLLGLDIEFRAKAGLPALLAERYFEHPRLRLDGARLDAGQQVELIRWEYQQRWRHGRPARRAEYEAAFPEHAGALRDLKPHCYCPRCQRVVVQEETYQTFVCPDCGGETPLPAAPPFVPAVAPPGRPADELDLRGYELVEPLGKGGMGEVYRCADPSLGRDLAIKVIKAKFRGDRECERRFLREARVTGSLQHPGIVAVHNLGRLPDGRLHYTMRLVRGRTFAEILKQEAGGSVCGPSLLGVFEKICQAVAYAHSRRVIHRDLKPSNVMVGKFGEVQVMDWGLAKLLTPGAEAEAPTEPDGEAGTVIRTESGDTPSDLSRVGSEMGTPAYMPPEQAVGDWGLVDERADVFALGSILCEMLTGRPAYTGSMAEVLPRARVGDLAEALARLEKCTSDAALITLCRDCLVPRREDRPRDAEAVARRVADYQAAVRDRLRQAELERARAVVRAQGERKFRRWTAAFVALLLVGIALTTWQAVRATSAEKKARDKGDELQKANTALTVLNSTFHDLNPRDEEIGGPTLLEQLGKNLERTATELGDAPDNEPLAVTRARIELGRALIGLGQTRAAIEVLLKARTVLEAQLGPDDPETLTCCHRLAEAYRMDGRAGDALRLYEDTHERRRVGLGENHPDTLSTRNGLAAAYSDADRVSRAIELFKDVLERQEAEPEPDPKETMRTRYNLAAAYLQDGNVTKAIRLLDTVLTWREANLGDAHYETVSARSGLADAYRRADAFKQAIELLDKNLRLCVSKFGANDRLTLLCRINRAAAYRTRDPSEALREYEETLNRCDARLGTDHPLTLICRNNLAEACRKAGRRCEAACLQDENLNLALAKLGPDHRETIKYRGNLAKAYRDDRRVDEALRLQQENLKRSRDKLGEGHPLALTCLHDLAETYLLAGQSGCALPLFEEALRLQKENLAEGHPLTLLTMRILAETYDLAHQFDKSEPYYRGLVGQARASRPPGPLTLARWNAALGFNLLRQKKYADSVSPLEECLTFYESKQPNDLATSYARLLLGEALAGQGKFNEAAPYLNRGWEGMKERLAQIPPANRDGFLETLQRLERLHEAGGRPDDAARWRKEREDAGKGGAGSAAKK